MRSAARPLLALLLCLAQLGDGLSAAWAVAMHDCGQGAATTAHASALAPTAGPLQASSTSSEHRARHSEAAFVHASHAQRASAADETQIAATQGGTDCTRAHDAAQHIDTTPAASPAADHTCDCEGRDCGCFLAGCTASILPAWLAIHTHNPQHGRRPASERSYPSPVLPYPLRPPIG